MGMGAFENGAMRPIKIVLVGDGNVGKTCLLDSYVNNSFAEDHVPTVFDNTSVNLTVDGVTFMLNLWDTAGQESYERLRPLSYPNTDCFLLCFAVDNPASFANVECKWIEELRHHCPTTAIVLIGTKSDLRSEKGPNACVPPSEAKTLRSKLKINAFLECSAKTRENLHQVFVEAIRVAVKKGGRKRNKRSCTVL